MQITDAKKINQYYQALLDRNKSFEGIYERELSLVKEVLNRINKNYDERKEHSL